MERVPPGLVSGFQTHLARANLVNCNFHRSCQEVYVVSINLVRQTPFFSNPLKHMSERQSTATLSIHSGRVRAFYVYSCVCRHLANTKKNRSSKRCPNLTHHTQHMSHKLLASLKSLELVSGYFFLAHAPFWNMFGAKRFLFALGSAPFVYKSQQRTPCKPYVK